MRQKRSSRQERISTLGEVFPRRAAQKMPPPLPASYSGARTVITTGLGTKRLHPAASAPTSLPGFSVALTHDGLMEM